MLLLQLIKAFTWALAIRAAFFGEGLKKLTSMRRVPGTGSTFKLARYQSIISFLPETEEGVATDLE